jgi:hypothetical protein
MNHLNNLKVVFAHNVFKRHKQLIKTISNNRKLIDDIKTIIVSNGNFLSYFKYNKVKKIKFYQFVKNGGHKLGALKTMLKAVSLAKEFNSDLIIFSHDDVYINDIELLNKNIEFLNEYDVVIRRPKQMDENYFMFDAFMIKTKVAKLIFNKKFKLTKKSIPLDFRGSPCPEKYFGNLILRFIPIHKIKIVDYKDETWGNTDLGFFHIPGRNWKEEN